MIAFGPPVLLLQMILSDDRLLAILFQTIPSHADDSLAVDSFGFDSSES